MGKNITLIVVAVVIIGLGIFFFMDREDADLGDNNDTTASQNESNNTANENGSSVEAGGSVSGEVSIEDEAILADHFEALVTFTDDGFSPKTVTIKEGEVVRFLNQSSRAFWPASDIHPTHTLYPEKTESDCLGSAFDACRAIEVGGIWEFVFTSSGEWAYHDHLRASRKGTVIVE